MTNMSEVQVTFITQPRVGERASMVVNGAPVTSSLVVDVQTNPRHPGWLSIGTQSGSRYIGVIGAEKTVYGMAAAPSSIPYVPARVAPDDGVGYVIAAAIMAVLSLFMFSPLSRSSCQVLPYPKATSLE